MKIETVSEKRERILRENDHRRVLGRTLPRGFQWNGIDQPGGGASKRRLRQQAKLDAKLASKTALSAEEELHGDPDPR